MKGFGWRAVVLPAALVFCGLLALGAKLALLGRTLDLPAWQGTVGPSNLAGLLAFVSLLLLFPLRHAWRLLILCSVVFSVLAQAEGMFFRYYQDLPTVSWLARWNQLPKIHGSLPSLVAWSDLLWLLDPLVLWWLLRRVRWTPDDLRARALVLVAGCGLALVVWHHRWILVNRPPADVYFTAHQLARKQGLVAYHWGDLERQARRLASRRQAPSDLAPARAMVEASRRSVMTPTPWWGEGRGLNVLVVVLESWQSFALELEFDGVPVMPFLSRYRQGCLDFTEVYDQTHQASSADGEHLMNLSLHPADQGAAVFRYQGNQQIGLPRVLRRHGYHTLYAGYYDGGFWNARLAIPSYGFERALFAPFGADPRPDEKVGWGLSDEAMLARVLPTLESSPRPFFAMAKCSMVHYPFNELQPEQRMLKLPGEIDGQVLGDYLQMCRFRDLQLSSFLYDFERSPLASSTVLVLTGDHATPLQMFATRALWDPAQGPPELQHLLAQKVPLLIRFPSGRAGTVTTPMGQIDFAPTLCHLLGVDPAPAAFLGSNVLAVSNPVALRRFAAVIEADRVSQLDEPARVYRRPLRGGGAPASASQAAVAWARAQWRWSDEILESDLVPHLAQPRRSGGAAESTEGDAPGASKQGRHE